MSISTSWFLEALCIAPGLTSSGGSGRMGWSATDAAIVPAGSDGCSWPPIPAELADLPVFLVDLDGTLRGDVLPMVKLARPLVPRFLRKVMFREPLRLRKLILFLWNLVCLWTLRTVFREHRRRYKHLFSELHHLAAALLQGSNVRAARDLYRRQLPTMQDLWHEGAVEFLCRMSRRGVIVLVTGSEQVQTEECVRRLASRGVHTGRIFVYGSLYRIDPDTGRYTGRIAHLNVTLDGKRDVVQYVLGDGRRAAVAMGNSRPDRALFEAAAPGGLCALVCSPSAYRRRKPTTFVVRKLHRSGYRVLWDADVYAAARDAFLNGPRGSDRPVLATDSEFESLLAGNTIWHLAGLDAARQPASLAAAAR